MKRWSDSERCSGDHCSPNAFTSAQLPPDASPLKTTPGQSGLARHDATQPAALAPKSGSVAETVRKSNSTKSPAASTVGRLALGHGAVQLRAPAASQVPSAPHSMVAAPLANATPVHASLAACPSHATISAPATDGSAPQSHWLHASDSAGLLPMSHWSTHPHVTERLRALPSHSGLHSPHTPTVQVLHSGATRRSTLHTLRPLLPSLSQPSRHEHSSW